MSPYNKTQPNTLSYIFFGTSELSVIVLEKMKDRGFLPCLIITGEDKPRGRKMILTPPKAKIWAEKNNIEYIQPKTLRDGQTLKSLEEKFPSRVDLAIVASYGKIIPQDILDFPTRETLNIHPSLLPKLRGASPIQSAIMSETETGVTIIRLDAEIDHGPILSQEKISVPKWPPYANDLEKTLAEKGAEMISDIIPKWMNGEITGQEQDHNNATFCKKIQKTDGQINLADNAEINLRKIRSYNTWPRAYFFVKKNDTEMRVIVTKAHIENGELVIEKVIPEGKKEMNYKDFRHN